MEVTEVKVENKAVGTGVVTVADSMYSGNTTAYNEGTTKIFKIADILDESVGAKDGSVIKIKYTSILNADAEIGSAGNPNKAYLEYPNNSDIKYRTWKLRKYLPGRRIISTCSCSFSTEDLRSSGLLKT